jgi:hypothetical protein
VIPVADKVSVSFISGTSGLWRRGGFTRTTTDKLPSNELGVHASRREQLIVSATLNDSTWKVSERERRRGCSVNTDPEPNSKLKVVQANTNLKLNLKNTS